MRQLASLVLACCLTGCAGSASDQSTVHAPAAIPIQAEQLHGFWAEYWGPGDKVQTQRHLFMPDGRWGWLCEQGYEGQTHQSGSWSFEGDQLSLQSGGKAQARVVNGCPPNEEAQAMDRPYRCITIDGRTFWWQSSPEAGDPAPFFDTPQ